MSRIITRSKSIGTSAEAGAGAGFQFFNGPGKLEALVVNFSASADGGTVLDIYDGVGRTSTGAAGAEVLPAAGNRTLIYTQTGNTDLGTTVPVTISGDADIVAGTSTAGVSRGLIFTDGLFMNVTLDVAGPQIITAFIRPLIKKTVNVRAAGSAGSAAGSASIWHGPALWHGYGIKLDSTSPSTLDITFKDNPIAETGNLVMTKTNYEVTPGTKVLRQVATTTGEDEAGAAITTAATGTYSQNGIFLVSGLNVTLAQGNALEQAVQIDALFEN